MSVKVMGSAVRLALELPGEGETWVRDGDTMKGAAAGGFSGGTVAGATTFSSDVEVSGAFTALGAPVNLNSLFSIDLAGKIQMGINGGDIEIASSGGVKIANVAGDTCGFFGSAGQTQQVFATGAGHTVDQLITQLQAFGLFRQS